MTPPPALIARLRRRSPAFQIGLLAACAALAALGHVHLHLAVLQAGYELSRETRLRRELADQNQKLRLELETRSDPSIVERRAREELHMAPPDPAAIRTLARAAFPAPADHPAQLTVDGERSEPSPLPLAGQEPSGARR
jgi:cell division protein FtsL